MKALALTMLLVLAVAIPSLAGETASTTPGSTNPDDVQQVLNRLKGSSGLYGAGPTEMNAFVDMVDTPELTKVVERLNRELLEQGGSEEMSLEEVSAFVQRSFTQQDASSILGKNVSAGDFQRGLQAGSDAQNLDMLVQMLQR